MKNVAILHPETNKIVYCAEWPEEPIQKYFYRDISNAKFWEEDDKKYFDAMNLYRKQCEQSIANGIEFKDRDGIKQIIWDSERNDHHCAATIEHWKMEPLKPYAIPKGLDISIRFKHEHEECRIECICTDDERYVVIIKSQPKEETQHDLWKEALSDYSTITTKFRIERIK